MKTIDDYSLLNYFLKRFYFNQIEVFKNADNLEQILKRYPRLVCAVNHGPAPAPFAVFAGVIDNYLKLGGAERKPLTVAWRGFYEMPLVGRFIRYVTQADKSLTAEEFLQKFEREGFTDLFVMPEGANCMFGDGEQIVSFVSPRFIELAIKINVPVLVITHSGTGPLASVHTLSRREMRLMKYLPSKVYQQVRETGILSLPHFTQGHLDKVQLNFRLYQPSYTEASLSKDTAVRYQQLMREAENVREMMIEMKDEVAGIKTDYPWHYRGSDWKKNPALSVVNNAQASR